MPTAAPEQERAIGSSTSSQRVRASRWVAEPTGKKLKEESNGIISPSGNAGSAHTIPAMAVRVSLFLFTSKIHPRVG
jgi:hypothetical protein